MSFEVGSTILVREVWWVQVFAAAPGAVDLLDRDDRWWAPWDDWTPTATPVES